MCPGCQYYTPVTWGTWGHNRCDSRAILRGAAADYCDHRDEAEEGGSVAQEWRSAQFIAAEQKRGQHSPGLAL